MPKKFERKITEVDYPYLFDRKCQGASVHSLALEYGVQWKTMQWHLQKCTLRNEAKLYRLLEEQLNELRLVRAAAWEAFKKSQRNFTQDDVEKEFAAGLAGVDVELVGRIQKQTTKMKIRDGDPKWLAIIIAANDMEAKLLGRYESGKFEGRKPAATTYRAAGRSPRETHELMAKRILGILGQRGDAAIVAGSN